MAETKPTTRGSTNAPRFSAGLVTALVTGAWLIIFAAVMIYGIDGIRQHDNVVSTQAE